MCINQLFVVDQAVCLQGSARVFRCLQDQRSSLSLDCKTALFDHEVIMAESINFNKPLAQACTDEVSRYCKGVASGDSRVLWCLRQHKDKPDFGAGCSKVRRAWSDQGSCHASSAVHAFRMLWGPHMA